MPEAIEPAIDQPVEQAPLSIADHAKQFSAARANEPEIEVDAEPDDPLKPIRPVDQQRREQGKFVEGKQRIKAKDAVDRINQLTGRAKTAEEKLVAAEAELVTLRAQRATPQQVATAERKVEQAQTRVDTTPAGDDPEPTEADLETKHGGDYAKFLEARSRWAVRDENRKLKAAAEDATRQGRLQDAERLKQEAFANRLPALRQKYHDYDRVALTTMPAWIDQTTGEPHPWGLAIDAFIKEDDNGGEALYYLNSHPDEHDALFRKSALQQIEALVTIKQRFASSSSPQAGTTGSAARTSPVVLPPKPPNPVRTEAQRASDSPPPTDGSLSIAEHRKQFAPTRR